ncbi:MAG: hypothetical protein WD990_00050 [Acidimicrobiia bacterium]
MRRRFRQVDVFATTPMRGNPVAVDAAGLIATTCSTESPAGSAGHPSLGRDIRGDEPLGLAQPHRQRCVEADGRIWVGGGTVTCVDGSVVLE